LLLLSAFAQATAFGFLAAPENTATTPSAWTRNLGNEERCTKASGMRFLAVVDQVSRTPFVLQQAQLASRSRAYVAFDGLLDSDAGAMGVADHLTAFLADPESKHRDALLACFADREVELEAGPLMTAVVRLLTATDSRTRRMAALALAAGGAVGEAELGKGLDALSVEWAEDIRATLRLSA
jgi:hypothetical protein